MYLWQLYATEKCRSISFKNLCKYHSHTQRLIMSCSHFFVTSKSERSKICLLVVGKYTACKLTYSLLYSDV